MYYSRCLYTCNLKHWKFNTYWAMFTFSCRINRFCYLPFCKSHSKEDRSWESYIGLVISSQFHQHYCLFIIILTSPCFISSSISSGVVRVHACSGMYKIWLVLASVGIVWPGQRSNLKTSVMVSEITDNQNTVFDIFVWTLGMVKYWFDIEYQMCNKIQDNT